MHEDLRRECPNCPKILNRRGKLRGIELELINDNYSGCGVDICRCPECGKDFQVSYKIDAVTCITEECGSFSNRKGEEDGK